MLSRLIRQFGEAEEKKAYDNILRIARTVCLDKQGQSRTEALADLQTIILRPLLYDLVRAFYLVPEGTNISFLDFFSFFGLNQSLFEYYGGLYQRDPDLQIPLASASIFPLLRNSLTPIQDLGTVGTRERINGEFEQTDNHKVMWVQPLSIGFATSGSFSIFMGMIHGSGMIKPESVYDISGCIDNIRYDGAHWLTNVNDVLGKPAFPEFGWVWEIQRMSQTVLV